MYRETPSTDDNAILIFETEDVILLAEKLFDSVGFAGWRLDLSKMETPTPGEWRDEDVNVETVVRVKFDGGYHTMTYDFDPCKDVVGWVGDPVLYKLNVWDVAGIGTTNGFLSPPANAIVYGGSTRLLQCARSAAVADKAGSGGELWCAGAP